MKKIFIWALVLVAVLVGGFYAFNSYIYNEKQAQGPADYKGAEFVIEGERVHIDGTATKYFGNELKTDLDGDGKEDVVFLITRNTGGSGTFYYAVGALNTANGYIGTDGYFLGDRVAPQSTEVSPNPKHKNVVVINYA